MVGDDTSEHLHYVMGISFIVRYDKEHNKAEWLPSDGQWVPYEDLSDVFADGSLLDSEEEALKFARMINERERR